MSLIDVLPQHRFDEAGLWHYLEASLPGFRGPPRLRQFQGGQSNPTFLIETPERRYVLRKQPPGKLLPSAHRVDREHQVLKALGATAFPVPPVRLMCEDAAVIGTPFFVMDYVAGRVFIDPSLPGTAPEQRRGIYLDLARRLADLHAADWRGLGLGGFGKPERYVARQIERWSGQYRAAETEPLPGMERLMAELPQRVPAEEEVTIVHGDYRMGNVIVDPTAPSIVAVLDWELATLGHPLSDLAYCMMFYRLPYGHPVVSGLQGLDLGALGIPDERAFLAAYVEEAGRDPGERLVFFLAFSLFRFCSICQGVYKRGLQGNAADQRAHLFREIAQITSERGAELLDA